MMMGWEGDGGCTEVSPGCVPVARQSAAAQQSAAAPWLPPPPAPAPPQHWSCAAHAAPSCTKGQRQGGRRHACGPVVHACIGCEAGFAVVSVRPKSDTAISLPEQGLQLCNTGLGSLGGTLPPQLQCSAAGRLRMIGCGVVHAIAGVVLRSNHFTLGTVFLCQIHSIFALASLSLLVGVALLPLACWCPPGPLCTVQ